MISSIQKHDDLMREMRLREKEHAERMEKIYRQEKLMFVVLFVAIVIFLIAPWIMMPWMGMK